MKYESAIPELFKRIPQLEVLYQSQLAYLADEEPLPYVVFGDILVPSLEVALNSGNASMISALCEYHEDAAASEDAGLENLIRIEVGEWLGFAANADQLAPFMGEETKRICGYVVGLATQRRALRGLR